MYTKILLICVLSFTALGRTKKIEISPACRVEFTQQAQFRDQCHSGLPTAGINFFADFNATVLDFSGNNEDFPIVEAFFTKHCELVPPYVQCSELSDDVSDECKLQIPNRRMKLIFFQGISSLIRYSCDNDADMLKRLIPHNGLNFLMLNDAFDRCVSLFTMMGTISEACWLIDHSAPCFEKTVGDHQNKYIIVFVREAINRFKSIANC